MTGAQALSVEINTAFSTLLLKQALTTFNAPKTLVFMDSSTLYYFRIQSGDSYGNAVSGIYTLDLSDPVIPPPS